MDNERTIRIGVYGAGMHAREKHLPNLQRLEGVEVVAVCDIDPENARRTANEFSIPGVYTNGNQMLEEETLDALWSVIPAQARQENVEIAAAAKGIHLFIEKPQALEMKMAQQIDTSIRQSKVLSTVCFRERYRPIFQEAKRLLQGRKIVHIRFQMVGNLPSLPSAMAVELRAPFLGWGPHAVDYVRYMSGLDITLAQAFFHQPEHYDVPLSTAYNFTMANGATFSMTFLSASPGQPQGEPYFLFYYEGGYLGVHNYSFIDMNGENIYQAQDFDPWFKQDHVFVEAIRAGNGDGILNDYHDGLYSLAPVLAGWESSRCGGQVVDVAAFMAR